MDKYEFHVKTDQIKKLVNEKNYAGALKIAETVDWTRVKNMSLLTMISEVYEKNCRYEESIDYLLMVYDRYPAGRTVVYKLAELYTLTGDYDTAIDFYREYTRIAPFDTAKDILKYKISRGKCKPVENLIKILENLKEKDYQEEWAYELAKLYHEAGRGDDCVSECDEIDLWFGEGTFVIKALELKMLYQPLTPIQMKKYENRYEYLDSGDELQEVNLDEQGEPGIRVKTVGLDKYDTLNLQEELARSMEQIMNAPDKETVDSAMKNVKKMVEDSNLQELIPEPVEYEKILEKDDDGQLAIDIPEVNILDKQITGQLTIEEIMKEWEKQMAAGQQALEESKARRLDIAREKALEETGNILERLADVLPFSEENAGGEAAKDSEMVSTQDLSRLKLPGFEEPSEFEEQPELSSEFLENRMEEVANEPLIEDISLTEGEVEEDGHVLDDMVDDLEESIAVDLLDLETTKEWVMTRDLIKDEPEEGNEPVNEAAEEVAAEQEAGDTEDEFEEPVQIPEPEEKEEPKKPEKKSEKKPEKKQEEKEEKPELSAQQQEILSYFMEIPSVRKEINGLGAHYPEEPVIVICGKKGTGKTSLATRIIKAAQLTESSVGKRIAKTSGESINQKDIVQILEKMVQGSLIIEGAEKLSKKSLETLEKKLPDYKGRVQLYLLGEENLEEVLGQNDGLNKLCRKRIHLPVYRNQELVVFAKSYAKSQKYAIDEMGELALYTRLGVKQTEYHNVDLDEVKEIIDEAIARSSKFSMKKFFGRIFSSRIDDDGLIILGEKDILGDGE